MGFTKSEQLFLGVREAALNDILAAFYFERHRYFDFGSTLGPTTASHTFFPPINLFNTAIPWRIELTLPQLDIHPGSVALPPPLVLGPGQFSGTVGAKITATAIPVSLTLQLAFIGHTFQVGSGSSAVVKLAIDKVKLVIAGLQPPLSTFLEGILLVILNAILANLSIPLSIFAFQPFQLVAGPIVGSDQIELRGNL